MLGGLQYHWRLKYIKNDSKDSKSYHCFIGKKSINADYSVLTDEIESSHNVPTFKVGDRIRITKYKNIFSKGYTENWTKEIFVIDSVLKTSPWTNKIKDLKRKTIIGRFYEKELLLSKL